MRRNRRGIAARTFRVAVGVFAGLLISIAIWWLLDVLSPRTALVLGSIAMMVWYCTVSYRHEKQLLEERAARELVEERAKEAEERADRFQSALEHDRFRQERPEIAAYYDDLIEKVPDAPSDNEELHDRRMNQISQISAEFRAAAKAWAASKRNHPGPPNGPADMTGMLSVSARDASGMNE